MPHLSTQHRMEPTWAVMERSTFDQFFNLGELFAFVRSLPLFSIYFRVAHALAEPSFDASLSQ